LPSGYWV
jgi:hypothetical protein